MFIKSMKWISAAGLILGAFWGSANYPLLLEIVVCVSSIVVFLRAFRTGRYTWAFGFAAIAMLFNPVQPVISSSRMFYWIAGLSGAIFLASLATLKSAKRLSLQSITSPLPSPEAL